MSIWWSKGFVNGASFGWDLFAVIMIFCLSAAQMGTFICTQYQFFEKPVSKPPKKKKKKAKNSPEKPSPAPH